MIETTRWRWTSPVRAGRFDRRAFPALRFSRGWWALPTLRFSHRVIAERKDPYLLEGSGPQRHLVGDRFVASYLYGPLGMIARSQEFDNADPKDNHDHYFLPDVMGNHVGLYLDDDGDPSTDRVARFNTFDSFGVAMDKPNYASGVSCSAIGESRRTSGPTAPHRMSALRPNMPLAELYSLRPPPPIDRDLRPLLRKNGAPADRLPQAAYVRHRGRTLHPRPHPS